MSELQNELMQTLIQEVRMLREEITTLKGSRSSYNRTSPLEATYNKRIVNIDGKISTILLELNVAANLLGYKYLREAIKMVVADPSLLSKVTKILYPEIAIKFKTSSSKVERAMRHAIETSWYDSKVDGMPYFEHLKTKPTNSEYIALIADMLANEEEKEVS